MRVHKPVRPVAGLPALREPQLACRRRARWRNARGRLQPVDVGEAMRIKCRALGRCSSRSRACDVVGGHCLTIVSAGAGRVCVDSRCRGQGLIGRLWAQNSAPTADRRPPIGLELPSAEIAARGRRSLLAHQRIVVEPMGVYLDAAEPRQGVARPLEAADVIAAP